jgi:hypothetical protein
MDAFDARLKAQRHRGQARRFPGLWQLLTVLAGAEDRAHSPHWGERPDPRRQGAAFSRIEDR